MTSSDDPATRAAPAYRTTRSCTLASRWLLSAAHHRFRFASRVASVSVRGSASPRTSAEELHRHCFTRVNQFDDSTILRRSTGSAHGQQRSRAGHPAQWKALCADGREPNTTAFVSHGPVASVSWQGGYAMPSHHASARLRIVLVGYLRHLWHAPATATRFAFT